MEELAKKEDKQVEITIREDGRQQIVFKKSILKGKVSSADVLNTVLIAARLQAEKFVEKLSRGATLDNNEIKALKELAEISKLEVKLPVQTSDNTPVTTIDVTSVKSALYKALTEKKE